ncbi:unnamed protein product [Symbiodinium natans]|uniref:Uncharacterized protein n=1 Tax=Symbiodinium natans TaxID=878477 RepID=A0A812K7M5_9DINO|nr:unnamed protein product [Symbiodinium natans]
MWSARCKRSQRERTAQLSSSSGNASKRTDSENALCRMLSLECASCWQDEGREANDDDKK